MERTEYGTSEEPSFASILPHATDADCEIDGQNGEQSIQLTPGGIIETGSDSL